MSRRLSGWGLGAIILSCAAPAAADWPSNVAGHTPPAAGEHPRLFFRKSDVPQLIERAQTADGKAILARLRATLGGGEAMPTAYNAAKMAYDPNATPNLPEGAYTVSHAAGYGLLYQLTNDAKYCDLARKSVELAWDGQRDRDDRYAWIKPGGLLRAGPSLAAYAMAYDLCYDAWEPSFRQSVAVKIQDYDGGDDMTLQRLAMEPRHNPGSNHWGSQVGGAGIALLAVKGDPGTDDAKVSKYLANVEKNALRGLTEGFGDGGYYWEHAGPSHVMANTAFTPFLRAELVANGKDYFSGAPNARWMTLRWVQEVLPSEGRPKYPCRHPDSYGTEDMLGSNGGMSHGGWFSQGFGAVTANERAALLWTYEHFVKATDDGSYDTKTYPHRAIHAFVNWPIGVEPVNPAQVIPLARHDSLHRYYVFRKGYEDKDDILVTALFGARDNGPEKVMVWGLGMKTVFGTAPKQAEAHFEALADGSGTMTGASGTALGIDYSSASGADAVIVMTGPGGALEGDASGDGGASAKTHEVVIGDRHYYVMTLQRGAAPAVSQEGEDVVIGGQKVHFDGKQLVFGVSAAPATPLPTDPGSTPTMPGNETAGGGSQGGSTAMGGNSAGGGAAGINGSAGNGVDVGGPAGSSSGGALAIDQAPGAATQEDGCGCRMVGGERDSREWVWLGASLLALVRIGRRRSAH